MLLTRLLYVCSYIVQACTTSNAVFSILQEIKLSHIPVYGQKMFRIKIRRYYCSDNLSWQNLFIIFFQEKLYFSLSKINYQLLTLSIEWWFCCNSKKIIFHKFTNTKVASPWKPVAWEYWMHFCDSLIFLIILAFADWFLHSILYVLISRERGRGWQWNGSWRSR